MDWSSLKCPVCGFEASCSSAFHLQRWISHVEKCDGIYIEGTGNICVQRLKGLMKDGVSALDLPALPPDFECYANQAEDVVNFFDSGLNHNLEGRYSKLKDRGWFKKMHQTAKVAIKNDRYTPNSIQSQQ